MVGWLVGCRLFVWLVTSVLRGRVLRFNVVPLWCSLIVILTGGMRRWVDCLRYGGCGGYGVLYVGLADFGYGSYDVY